MPEPLDLEHYCMAYEEWDWSDNTHAMFGDLIHEVESLRAELAMLRPMKTYWGIR